MRAQPRLVLATVLLAGTAGLTALAPPSPAAPKTEATDHRASPPGDAIRNEPSVAVDPRNPRHLATASNDYSAPSIGVFLSRDGGVTWRTANPPALQDATGGADPHVLYARGSLYAAYLSMDLSDLGAGGLVVARYDEKRDRWTPAVARKNLRSSAGCRYTDFPALAADVRGVLYLAWQEHLYAPGCQAFGEPSVGHPVLLSHSRDSGRTWSSPAVVRAGKGDYTPSMPSLTTGPRNDLYVTYNMVVNPTMETPCLAGNEYAREVRVARTVDGGRSFADTLVQTVCQPSPPFGVLPNPTGVYPSSLTGATYRLGPTSNTVVDPRTGHLVSVVGRRDPGTNEQTASVRVSTDRGRTWRPGGDVPRHPLENQQFPRLAVGRDGRVSLVWIAQLPGGLLQATHSWSFDGGRSWRPPERIATVPSRVTWPFALGFIGDYLGNAVGPDGLAHPVWTDLRDTGAGTIYTRAIAP